MKFSKQRLMAYLNWRIWNSRTAIDDPLQEHEHSEISDAMRYAINYALRSVLEDVENWNETEYIYGQKIDEFI